MRMRTLAKALFAFSALALPASLATSCAIDGCIDNPQDSRCTTAPTSDISVLTGRLPKSGGQINIQVRNLATGNRVRGTLGSGGPTVNFTMNADGTGSTQVSQAMLSSIPLGGLPLLVQVTQGDSGSESVVKAVSVTLHIFTPANFTDPTKVTLPTGARQPTWTQIAQGHLFATLDNATDKRINEYQFSGSTLTQLGTRDTHLNTIPSSSPIDVTNTQTVRLLVQAGQTFSLEYADLTGTGPYASLKTLTYSKAYAVAADRKSSYVAVAGEGTDGPLKFFTLPPMGQQPAQINITGLPAGKQPVALAWGLIDSDTAVDLVAVNADNSVSVFIQKNGQGMAYDATLSNALQTAAGLQGAVAVSVAIGDVDLDGLEDVIFLQSGLVVELANEGTGSFTKTVLLNGVTADSVAVGDLNVDGKADLAFAQKAASMLAVYPNLAQ